MTHASPAAQYRQLVAAFLAAHARPCPCSVEPIDLREDDGIRCASCDRQWLALRSEGTQP